MSKSTRERPYVARFATNVQGECFLFTHKLDFNMRIGLLVRQHREAQGLTLRDVDRISCGSIAFSQLAKLESGKQNWLPHHLELVATVLQVEPRDLIPTLNEGDPLPGPSSDELGLLEAVRARDWPRAMVMLGELATQPDKDAER